MAQQDGQACQAPADRFKVPTLRANTNGEPCDRTDYTNASKLNVDTSEVLHKETDRLLKERKLDDLATLTPQQFKERDDVEKLVQKNVARTVAVIGMVPSANPPASPPEYVAVPPSLTGMRLN